MYKKIFYQLIITSNFLIQLGYCGIGASHEKDPTEQTPLLTRKAPQKKLNEENKAKAKKDHSFKGDFNIRKPAPDFMQPDEANLESFILISPLYMEIQSLPPF